METQPYKSRVKILLILGLMVPCCWRNGTASSSCPSKIIWPVFVPDKHKWVGLGLNIFSLFSCFIMPLDSWDWSSFSAHFLGIPWTCCCPHLVLSSALCKLGDHIAARLELVQALVALFPVEFWVKHYRRLSLCLWITASLKRIHIDLFKCGRGIFGLSSLFLLQWGDLGREDVCLHLTDKSQKYTCQPLGYSDGGELWC